MLPVRSRVVTVCLAALLPAGASLSAAACAPRAINVSSGTEAAAAGLSFTNQLRTAVNVYVRPAGGDEVFVRQVPAGATEALVIRNVPPGGRVSLRAAPADGAPAYTRSDVVLGNGATWTVP